MNCRNKESEQHKGAVVNERIPEGTVVSQESIEVLDVESLVELANKGLLALSLQVGLEVFRQMLEADVQAQAGLKGKHNPERATYRHGTERTRVVMGGQKVSVQRPRVRSKEGNELTLPTLRAFQDEDPLNRALLSRLLSGVSTRKYGRRLDGTMEEPLCVSKSEVSRRFTAAMEDRMDTFFKRRIEGSYPAMMLDGLELGSLKQLRNQAPQQSVQQTGCQTAAKKHKKREAKR